MTRRGLIAAAAWLARDPEQKRREKLAREGRLPARPAAPTGPAPKGEQPIGLGGKRDGVLYVPPSYDPARPAPFVLSLHGAGGSGKRGFARLAELAAETGMIVLAPDSRGQTWDMVLGGFGPDVAFIDSALDRVFRAYAVDPARAAIEGFSDGASYALSLGVLNGGLFTHVLAFSPGFMQAPRQEGAPRIFVAHGVDDRILPIDNASRRIVKQLRKARYDVIYREFAGGHAVSRPLVREAVGWFTGQPLKGSSGTQ